MTPKEKAEELYSKMYGETPVRAIIAEIEQDKQYAKQCALIAVDEIIDCTPSVDIYPFNFQQIQPRVREYWKEVKKELEKL